MAYVKIPETLLYNNAALRNSAAMRAWLYLYTSSTSATTWANKAYPVGQRVSSRSFVADALEVGDGVVKNVYKALSKWGLVDFVVEPTIKTNVATVAAVTIQHGYIYAELPDNYKYCFLDSEHQHHWQVYLYLMLHAAKERCKLFTGRVLERGQALLTQGSIAKALRISLTEIKEIFDDLRNGGLITTERVGNDGLMTTMTKYQSKIDGTATDEEIAAAKEKYGNSTDNTTSTEAKEAITSTVTDPNTKEKRQADVLEDAVICYSQKRRFKDPDHINDLAIDTAEFLRKIPDLDYEFVKPCLMDLAHNKGNNIVDEKGKPKMTDHIYLSNYVKSQWSSQKYSYKFDKFVEKLGGINAVAAAFIRENCTYSGFDNSTLILAVSAESVIHTIEDKYLSDIRGILQSIYGNINLNYIIKPTIK